jgi:CBS domain-containing protein
MTAIFGTPISAVLLAIELLLFEFNPRSLVPVAAACGTAAAVRIWLFGTQPAFVMAGVHAPSAQALVAFAVLGGLLGIAATAVSRAVYWVEEQFERLPIHWMWWPALGGVAVGAIGYYVPRTLGVGYSNIEDILSNRLPLGIVAALCAAKFISWAISLGSGTSGGTLAPLLTIGAGLGALLAAGLQFFFPGAHIEIGMGALVGMAAMFAGASRALLASVAFAFEATGQPGVLPALLVGGTCAYLLSHLLMNNTIMTEKIVRRGVRIPHGYEADALRKVTVGEVMSASPQTIAATMMVRDLARRIAENDPDLSRHQSTLILTPEGDLAGIITRSDLMRAVEAGREDATVAEVGTNSLIVAFPEDTVREALCKLLQHEIGRLPVVDPVNPKRVVGYLGRRQILSARSLADQEESIREPGWLASGLGRRKRELAAEQCSTATAMGEEEVQS